LKKLVTDLRWRRGARRGVKNSNYLAPTFACTGGLMGVTHFPYTPWLARRMRGQARGMKII
jgi:hypothetical protein